MPASQIVGSSFEEGLRAPHYINRRLLTAEDLKTDQQAVLSRLALLGKACGYGIVEGLVVEQMPGSSTGISIESGLGLTHCGNPVRLPRQVQLTIGPQATTGQIVIDAGRFHDCDLNESGPAGTTTAGAYVLTAAPTSKLEGTAPIKAAAGSTSVPACAAQWEVEGLQFKAIKLIGFDAEPDVTDANRRNRLAHWCYGSSNFPAIERDPLNFSESYGGLATVSSDDLTDCDLPLAVFYWTGSALGFVDCWAVRRRPIRPSALTAASGILSDRRIAEGQARFLQFQEHLHALQQSATTTNTVTAATHFPLLPPAGCIPARVPNGYLQRVVQQLASEALIFIRSQNQIETVRLRFTLSPTFGTFAGLAAGSVDQTIIDLVIDFVLKHVEQNGASLETFFGDLPLTFWQIERDLVDELLHSSWLRNALVVEARPQVDIYIPGEDTIQLVGAQIVAGYESVARAFGSNEATIALVKQWVTTFLINRRAAYTGRPPSTAAFDGQSPTVLFVRNLAEPIWVQGGINDNRGVR